MAATYTLSYQGKPSLVRDSNQPVVDLAEWTCALHIIPLFLPWYPVWSGPNSVLEVLFVELIITQRAHR